MVKRIVIDTNVFAMGFLELEGNIPESKVLNELKKEEYTIITSQQLEDEIRGLIKKLKNKDKFGKLLHYFWHNYKVEAVPTEECLIVAKAYKNKVPRKDLQIFATAITGKADYLITNNREFLRKASAAQKLFKCLMPEEFLKEFEKEKKK